MSIQRVPGADVKDESITSKQIQDDTITGIDIKDGTIDTSDIKDLAITSTKIANGAVVDINVGNVSWTKLTWNGYDFNTFTLDNTVLGSKIKDNTIAGSKIVNGTFANINHTHNNSDIIGDTTHRFVTDNQINYWNNKAEVSYVDSKIAALVNTAPTTLDTLKELADALGDDPNFATTVATQLGNKVDKIVGKGLSTNDFDNNYKTKLDGIANNATLTQTSTINGNIKINGAESVVYTHPSTHPVSMITGLATVATSGSYNDLSNKPAAYVLPIATSLVLGGVKQGANVTIAADGTISVAAPYVHPSTHAPSIIVQDTNNRFVTDAQISTWNAKQNALGFTPENIANKNIANGYAGLDSTGKLALGQIPGITAAQIVDGAIMDAEINANAGIAISKINIPDNSINGSKIIDYSISYTKLNVPNNTVPGSVFQDGSIPQSKLQNWQSGLMPEGIFYQSFELEAETNLTYTGLGGTPTTTAWFDHFYLPFPINFNYLHYIINSGGGVNDHVRFAFYDMNGNLIYDSGHQSALKSEYKIPTLGMWLNPGQYYYIIKSSNGGCKFVTGLNSSYTLVARSGLYNVGSYSNALPNPLNFTNIVNSGIGQPWFGLAKY